jgi:site-specific DNA-methyltransferase (adenine-specific)
MQQPNPQRNTILVGDALARLRTVPSGSADCVITSPPYYAQRDYGVTGQLGTGKDIKSWVAELRTICAELARVLAPHGSLWLNVGDGYSPHQRYGAPRKSLLCGPERLLLALVADGWTVRNKVVWAKTNPMPSSIRDRLSTTHEVLYFLTRSPRYYFDLDAIRVPLTTTHPQPPRQSSRRYPPNSAVPPARADWTRSDNRGLARLKAAGLAGHPLGKNPGDVWTLPTAGFRGAHFATFPTALVERPLLATCPERVCADCHTPWRRRRSIVNPGQPPLSELQPDCECSNAGHRPGLVLDPFFGSGTVGLVAERHQRDWLGIELNPEFAAIALKRIEQSRPTRYTRRSFALVA